MGQPPCSRGAPHCSVAEQQLGPSTVTTQQWVLGTGLWKRQRLHGCEQIQQSFLGHFWASHGVHPCLGRMKFIAAVKWCSTSEQGLSQPSWPWQTGHINSCNLLTTLWKPFKGFLSLCPELQLTAPSSYGEGEVWWMHTIAALERETCYNGTCRDW